MFTVGGSGKDRFDWGAAEPKSVKPGVQQGDIDTWSACAGLGARKLILSSPRGPTRDVCPRPVEAEEAEMKDRGT